MQFLNEGISYDLDFYNFVQYPQNILKHIFQANAYLQYSNMGDEKYLIMSLNIA
jgi:hypothetical protein